MPSSAQSTGQISGTVTDFAGAPIYSARVTFPGLSYQVITGDDGAFFLTEVPIGLGTLTALFITFLAVSREVFRPVRLQQLSGS
jgi:hypothetical protein